MEFDPDNKASYIVVATTRPETMLGDTAVAVHPEDERYKSLVGKNAILPLVGRRIPIVADEYSDPEKGSGAVKITPAHDFNDFEVGRRHGLPMVNVLSPDAKLLLDPNPEFAQGVAPSAELRTTILELNGVFRFAARKLIVERLEARGLIEKIEPHVRPIQRRDRAAPDRPVVCRCRDAGQARDRSDQARPHHLRAEELGNHLLSLDGEHSALVHFAPVVVGPSDSGLVRA
jgi:valyl-tRNA synthetase